MIMTTNTMTYHDTKILSVDQHGARIQVGARIVETPWHLLEDAAAQRDHELARRYQALYGEARRMRDAQAVAWRILMAVDGEGELIGSVHGIAPWAPYTAEAAQRVYESWRARYRHTQVYGYRVELLWPEDLEREEQARQDAIRLSVEIDRAKVELLRGATR